MVFFFLLYAIRARVIELSTLTERDGSETSDRPKPNCLDARSPITNRLPADARLLPERLMPRWWPPLLTREVGREFISVSAKPGGVGADSKIFLRLFYLISDLEQFQTSERNAFSKRFEWKVKRIFAIFARLWKNWEKLN